MRSGGPPDQVDPIITGAVQPNYQNRAKLHLTLWSAASLLTASRRSATSFARSAVREEQQRRTRKMCTDSRRSLCSTSKSRLWQNSRLVMNRIRSASAALLLLVCVVTLTSAFNLPNTSLGLSSGLASLSTATRKPAQQRTTLTLADRVAYQRTIEEVYWQHRIWPKVNAGPKPSLDKVMSQAQIEKKVDDYLRKSQAFEDYWQRQITPEQLQTEMERIASHTKQPGGLREIFAALGNGPLVL